MTADKQLIVNVQQLRRSVSLLSNETENELLFVPRDLGLMLCRNPEPDSSSTLTGGNLQLRGGLLLMDGQQGDRDRHMSLYQNNSQVKGVNVHDP